ncbi:threonine/serine dehydratase [Inquilinus limosus]|uniref:Serine/threonine dehydratase n=1 Tax=Inquilinus limosus TaxID=171674 RepID=A0A211ZN08_9PROT|nr:threonine/serine dehydratase [Inquilinus limosus]OWJ66663.1 serine/threonine dehydratase [Inquilinus limosus]
MTELFDRIMAAHAAIRPQVPVTPLERSAVLSAALGCEVLLKAEHLQPSGAFKLRGATNRISTLSEAERRRGVTTASTGNHGMAVARAGALAGTAVRVHVAAGTARTKTDAILALGAELVVIDGPPIEAEASARRDAAASGRTYIPPYNDPDVMAGQGTVGVELMQQAPDLDAVFIAVGGGGLIGGTGTAIKRIRPQTRVVGVWAENSPVMLRALEVGAIVDVEESETLSDGTAGAVEAGSVTFPVCQSVIDERVLVSEAEIARAMRQVAEAEHWIVEGSAGVALAGLVRQAEAWRGRTVAVVLCGRNIALDTFLQAISAA